MLADTDTVLLSQYVETDAWHNPVLVKQMAVHSHEKLDLDRIMFIPARLPPHKGQPTAKAADRLAMVRLAVAEDERFLVCDCELGRAEPSYTIQTVRQLQSSLFAGSRSSGRCGQ